MIQRIPLCKFARPYYLSSAFLSVASLIVYDLQLSRVPPSADEAEFPSFAMTTNSLKQRECRRRSSDEPYSLLTMFRLLLLTLCLLNGATAFTSLPHESRQSVSLKAAATTMDPPTKERTYRETQQDDEWTEDDIRRDGPLEYLEDFEESREMDDPFHILLLASTFDKPKITVTYVSGSLEYVLDMPILEATELCKFAKDQGMSCLGTWTREECLKLGKQLQVRDIVCRVVPYCEGGQRGWQAKDANDGYMSNAGGRSLE